LCSAARTAIRGDRLVTDVLVHELRGLPQRRHVDAGVEPEPRERGRERLARDPVEGQRDRVDRAGNEVGSGPRGFEARRHRIAAGALTVEADRQAARLLQRLDELLGPLGLERARGIVQQYARGAELGQLARLRDQRVGLVRVAGAEDEPRVELLARARDRLAGLAQVLDVVQRVVQAEDLDPALGGRGDEAADELAADRSRADEETAAQRHRERCLRAFVQRSDPFPRALHAAAHSGVEDAAARDLEVREAGLVEDLRQPQQLGRRHQPGERLLGQQADRGVDEGRHEAEPSAPHASRSVAPGPEATNLLPTASVATKCARVGDGSVARA
jgi:hypothetical protein